jgi:hypothetical protein
LTNGFTMYPRLASNSRSSCLSFLSAWIIGMYHHAQPEPRIFFLS